MRTRAVRVRGCCKENRGGFSSQAQKTGAINAEREALSQQQRRLQNEVGELEERIKAQGVNHLQSPLFRPRILHTELRTVSAFSFSVSFSVSFLAAQINRAELSRMRHDISRLRDACAALQREIATNESQAQQMNDSTQDELQKLRTAARSVRRKATERRERAPLQGVLNSNEGSRFTRNAEFVPQCAECVDAIAQLADAAKLSSVDSWKSLPRFAPSSSAAENSNASLGKREATNALVREGTKTNENRLVSCESERH